MSHEGIMGEYIERDVGLIHQILCEMKDDRPTLRDRFAMAALIGLLAEPCDGSMKSLEQWLTELPFLTYRYADAMLAARTPNKSGE